MTSFSQNIFLFTFRYFACSHCSILRYHLDMLLRLSSSCFVSDLHFLIISSINIIYSSGCRIPPCLSTIFVVNISNIIMPALTFFSYIFGINLILLLFNNRLEFTIDFFGNMSKHFLGLGMPRKCLCSLY